MGPELRLCKRGRADDGVDLVVEVLHESAVDAGVQPVRVNSRAEERILGLNVEPGHDRQPTAASLVQRGEREPERKLEMYEVDVLERSRQDASIGLGHHEAGLTHGSHGKL